jgi:hypothetical protein
VRSLKSSVRKRFVFFFPSLFLRNALQLLCNRDELWLCIVITFNLLGLCAFQFWNSVYDFRPRFVLNQGSENFSNAGAGILAVGHGIALRVPVPVGYLCRVFNGVQAGQGILSNDRTSAPNHQSSGRTSADVGVEGTSSTDVSG